MNLFETPEKMPPALRAVVDNWQDRMLDGLSYQDCEAFLKEVEAVGFTFDYYLDAEPYDLQPIQPDLNASWLNGKYVMSDGDEVEINTAMPHISTPAYFFQGDDADVEIKTIHEYWLRENCTQQEAVNWWYNHIS